VTRSFPDQNSNGSLLWPLRQDKNLTERPAAQNGESCFFFPLQSSRNFAKWWMTSGTTGVDSILSPFPGINRQLPHVNLLEVILAVNDLTGLSFAGCTAPFACVDFGSNSEIP